MIWTGMTRASIFAPRRLLLITTVLVGLFWSDRAYALVTYDSLLELTISFSLPWSQVTSGANVGGNPYPTEATTSGSGQYAALTSVSQEFDDLTYHQAVGVTGFAGDAGLIEDGTSEAVNSFTTLFHWDFGSTPTDFSFMYAWDITSRSSRQLSCNVGNGTGECVHVGGGGIAVLLNNQFYLDDQLHTFAGLTGAQTMLIHTVTHGDAFANYPFVVPEPSTFLLTTAALGGIIAAMGRRRVTSATPPAARSSSR